MEANPAPTAERLARAESLVTQAANAGAQLVVLPELFNTGYQCSPANHTLAEPMHGSTPTWMQETAWLGVPAVNTVGCGTIHTDVPQGAGTLLTILPIAPHLAKYLPQAEGMQLSCEMVQGCKVVDGNGRVLPRRGRDRR